MRITFMGAAETVTGSCFLVETEHTSFLVDCGLHQGQASETRLNRIPFPFDVNKIDFMLLTHAHIDHCGRIPKLYVDGFDKDIYTTKATAELCAIMLPDSGHIQEMEQEWQNRKNSRAGKPIEDPLYTMQNGIDACRLFKKVSYNTEFSPASDVRVIMRDAGHILGSSILEIWIKEDSGDKEKETKIVFSGDLGNKDIPILRDPSIIDGTDYLVIESTYGDRLHEKSINKVERLIGIINETLAKGGNVVIPSFAVGRTQEIIYELNSEEEKYKDLSSALMKTPVYVDSPMAVSATRVFRENEDCFDDEARQYISNGDNPLDFPNLHFTASVEESKELNLSQESKIIISASGMCDAGRIKHHLKHNLWRKDSTIIFVGYQAVGTLGRKLLDGARKVRIFDEEIAVNARLESIEGFSGHADRDGLLNWIGAMQKKPVKIMLVHGEPEVIKRFAGSIMDTFGIETYTPVLDESVILGNSVVHAEIVTQRIVSSVPSPMISTAASSDSALGGFEKTLEARVEECRNELKAAKSENERRSILNRYKTLLQKETDELLARIH